MKLLSAWALAGLLLSVPLVLLHLRRRRPPRQEISSLLAWRDLPAPPSVSKRRLGPPPLPLLLALQLAALVLLVLALARPAAAARGPVARDIYVVDTSIWMQAPDGALERMAEARQMLDRRLARLPAQRQVRLIAAAATPIQLYSGPAEGAVRAVSALVATAGPANLPAALRLAAGLRSRMTDPILLLRAPEDRVTVSAGAEHYEELEVGKAFAGQVLTDAQARCELPGESSCEVFARVQNSSPRAQLDRVELLGSSVPSHFEVTVPAGGSEPVAFHVPPGLDVELRLHGSDLLSAAAGAFVAVPEAGQLHVTLVGKESEALPLARALEAAPQLKKLEAMSPSQYRAGDAATSDLLVLDGWLPAGGLPPAPALMLIDPPRLPGGSVLGPMQDPRLSGSANSSEMLAMVDLSALTIAAGKASRLALPPWLTALAWSPEGPLIASGTLGGQRLSVLAFQPAGSNLPQLSAFPLLISRLMAYSEQWTPQQAVADEPLSVQVPPGTSSTTITRIVPPGRSGAVMGQGLRSIAVHQPGLYRVSQKIYERWRSRVIAINPGVEQLPPSSAVVQLSTPASFGPAALAALWPWLLAAALLVLLLEWLYLLKAGAGGLMRARPRVGS